MTRKGWIAVGGLSALSLVLAVALVISLSSGDDSGEAGGVPAGFAPPGGDQFDGPMGAPIGGPPEELQECLSDEGVELPEPGQAPSVKDQEALREAFEACADVLPQGGTAPPGGMIEP